MVFKKGYFFVAAFIFLVEVLIALYMYDRIIRPYGGDFLVVILLYCLLRAFWNQNPLVVAISVLLFSFVIEIAQYFHIVEVLGLKGNSYAETIIGVSFEWFDLVAYFFGVLTVFVVDTAIDCKKNV